MKHPLVLLAATATSVMSGLLVNATDAFAEPDFPNLEQFVAASAKDYSAGPDLGYPMLSFTAPNGLHCAISSSRGSTGASCYGAITGAGPGVTSVSATDYQSSFGTGKLTGISTEAMTGRYLPSGQKLTLGPGAMVMGGDQITCAVDDNLVACAVDRKSGDRRGFVVKPEGSYTF